jgi:hypothetical protein
LCNVDPTDTDAIARLLDSTDPARISTDTGVRVNVTKDQFGTWGLTANALIPALGEIKSRELWKALESDTDNALDSSLKKGRCKLTIYENSNLARLLFGLFNLLAMPATYDIHVHTCLFLLI